MEDDRFEFQVLETQKLCNILNSIIQQVVTIQGFEVDPYNMAQDKFEEFYECIKKNLLSTYERKKRFE